MFMLTCTVLMSDANVGNDYADYYRRARDHAYHASYPTHRIRNMAERSSSHYYIQIMTLASSLRVRTIN